MPEYLRVTDDVKPRREYTIVASALDSDHHKVLDKDATQSDGVPLAPKYTPEPLSNKSGQKATTKEEAN